MSRPLSRLLPSLILSAACLCAPMAAQATDPSLAGFGDSMAMPMGDEWQLPAYIQIMGVTGYSPYVDDGKCEMDPAKIKGSGGMVLLCLELRVGQPDNSRFQLPPGLLLISKSRQTQHGILVTREEAELQPNTTMYMPIALMCINSSRSGSAPGDEYEVGPVTNNPAFQQLFALLETKRLSSTVFAGGDGADIALVQEAVFTLASGHALSSATISKINALPNK